MVRISKIIILVIVGVTFVTCCALVYYNMHIKIQYPTYYNYSSQEKKSLGALVTPLKMSGTELKKWDNIMFDLIKSNKLGDAHASRIYAYVYVAQSDAAFLSFNANQDFRGSLDWVSAKTLCLFFVDDCSSILVQANNDPYSEKLAEIVQQKTQNRLNAEKSEEKLSSEKLGDDYWQGVKPYFGQEVASWQPWIIKNPNFYLPDPPPPANSPALKNQLVLTETALKNITPRQIKAVVFWAGNPSTITPPGMWLKFTNDYMNSKHVNIAKVFLVRSILARGIADSIISTFNAKYTYWVKRPFMLNSKLQTVMPTPNHPSYPAGHSVISATAATILSYYFPKNTLNWWLKANEASLSRSWGGIHFPLDGEAGLLMGKKIGTTVTRVFPNLDRE